VKAINGFSGKRRLCAALLVGTMLGGGAVPVLAQTGTAQPQAAAVAPAAQAAPAAPLPGSGTIRQIVVTGNQRLEPETVISYMKLRPGELYTPERGDEALKDLFATELFADVGVRFTNGIVSVEVRENPVINRIVLEGNKRIKDDKISPEIRLAPRQIFTRSKARADVARIIELYRRQGRFGANVEPKMVQLEQNRVDVVFEIQEGPKSKVQQINILGNEHFSDSELRGEMLTKQSRLTSILSGNTSYDPDRLAFDQQKLRQFYLTKGYADFRVVSAVAELTPDRRDFIITYVVEEGERYRVGDVKVESQIRDLASDRLQAVLPLKSGDWFNAKQIEDTVTQLNETAGLFGYAFAAVEPDYQRDREKLTMGITFKVAEAPRVYVERIDVNGNTNTRDKVIRREFRLAEGDPFNTIRVKRSQDRIQSLGYFQEKLEVTQEQGSGPDRVVLGVDVEEKATGELQLSAGFSSLERFLINLSVRQRNFMGKGQELRASVNYSSYSKSVELGFTEPYLFDRNIAVGVDLYRRDFSNFNYIGNNERNTTYKQTTTGGQLRTGFPITEYMSLAGRYSVNYDEITLDRDLFFTDPDGSAGPLPAVCDPLRAGRYLCDAVGNRVTSSIGYSLAYSNLNNGLRPSRGHRIVLSQDFAGLGGDVKYLRTRLNGAKYFDIGRGFIFSTNAEAGYIHSFENENRPGVDAVRITDRFFLGEPQMRGFDIRGVGPRVLRTPYVDLNGTLSDDKREITDDSLGGRAYYLGRLELEIPLGSSGRELGLRPSLFVDAGALFGLKNPTPGLLNINFCNPDANTGGARISTPRGKPCPAGYTASPGFVELYRGDSPRPRVSVGAGVNWNSPFGPFRIDIAKAITKVEGDDTKLFTFNVGTAF
jgi:outer membrane protein insertion porin family